MDRQMSFEDAIEQREEGMALVARNAEEDSPGFQERAKMFVLDFLGDNGPHMGEDIVDACRKAGIIPHNDKAFGPVFMHLSRLKKIVKLGSGQRRKGHAAPGATMWALAGIHRSVQLHNLVDDLDDGDSVPGWVAKAILADLRKNQG